MSAPGAASGLSRRPLDPETDPTLGALARAVPSLELLIPAAGGDEAALLDGLDALLGGAGTAWVVRVDAPAPGVDFRAAIAAAAGIEARRAVDGLVAIAPDVSALRALLEDAGGGPATALLVPLRAGSGDRALTALRTGDIAAAAAATGLAVLHHAGTAWAALAHDPALSGLPAAAGAPALVPDEVPRRHRRGRLRTIAEVGAVVLAMAALATGLTLAQRSDPRSPASPPRTSAASASPAGLPATASPPPGDLVPGSAPVARQMPASAADPASRVTLLFGGVIPNLGGGRDAGDTWTWAAGSWRRRAPSVSDPPARHGALLAPLPAGPAGTFLMVGGQMGGAMAHDAWSWNQTVGWRPLPVSAVPEGVPVAMATDAARATVVLVTRLADGDHTEVLTGTEWRDAGVPTPGIRLLAGGGSDVGVVGLSVDPGAVVAPAHTYRWSGAEWLTLAPAQEPEVDVLTATVVAPDPSSGGGVLLAESDLVAPTAGRGGTWAFDGAQWRHGDGPTPAYLRAFDATAAVWGLDRDGAPVLLGGSLVGDAYLRAERWNGRGWSPGTAPPGA